MPRMLVIIIAVFIMLAGAAVTVMQQMELGPFAPQDPEAAAAPADGEPAASGPSLEPPRFVNMDPFVIPVFEGDRIAGTVQLQVQLETTAEKESQLNKLLPRVSDAFVQDLHGYLPRLLRDKQQLDVDLIKRRLVIIAERAIGKGLIDNVLIQSAIDRPAQ